MGSYYRPELVCSDSTYTSHVLSRSLMLYRGIVATCQAAVQNWGGLMALRFLLGMSEAAFGPGSPYLLSFFYRRHELGLRCGMFLSAAPLANTFAGALAYAITSGHAKIANWRLLFLVEGSPSLLAAILAWFYLPDHPSSARFLTEEEKEVTRARSLRRSGESERVSGIDWKELGHTLLDAKAWILAVCSQTSRLRLGCMLTTILVHVLQLQRELLIIARFFADDPGRYGVYLHQRSGADGTAILCVLPRHDRYDMGC